MPLAATAIRLAKLRDRAYKLADGRGLCLLVQPNGAKWWRYRFVYQGAKKMLSFGIYADVRLSEARDWPEAARRQLRVIALSRSHWDEHSVARSLLIANRRRAAMGVGILLAVQDGRTPNN
jgi:hypothetical protein